MKRRPNEPTQPALSRPSPHHASNDASIGVVLSGGGTRAAYQIGALRALAPVLKGLEPTITVVVGSSIGAVNGILLGTGLRFGLSDAIDKLEDLWRMRTFRNTFAGTPSQAFFRAVKVAILNYARNPGPTQTNNAIFDPAPLMNEVDSHLETWRNTSTTITAEPSIGIMTTIEGSERKPLLFLSRSGEIPTDLLHGASFQIHHVKALSAKHSFASAALPTVLPPVTIDVEGGAIRLVDGGISQNIPVDPAVRLGADRIIVLDVSGRRWWHDRYSQPHDQRPNWEVPAGDETFCMRPPESFIVRNDRPFGPLLKDVVGGSTRTFMAALGAAWPVFQLIKARLGEELAYEICSYIALHPDYATALIERGFNEATTLLRNRTRPPFAPLDTYRELLGA